MTDLKQLTHQIIEINTANGWFDIDCSFSDGMNLLHEEVAEAYREWRNGHEPGERYYVDGNITVAHPPTKAMGKNYKPEGVPTELADLIIRVLDTCYRYGIDIEDVIQEKLAYNATRGYRHGGKRT